MPIRQATQSLGSETLPGYVDSLLGRDSQVTVLAPPPALLVTLTTGTYRDPPVDARTAPPIRVVARPDVLDALAETFQVGHQAAELADRDLIGYRALASVPVSGPLVVADGRVASVVSFEGTYTLIEGDRSPLVSVGTDHAAALWERAEPALDTDVPEWREMTVSLTAVTSRETALAFGDLLAARRIAAPDRTLDVPTLAVLAGACTGARQKDVADWCTRRSIAAASTVSARKRRLDEHGLVTTEPIQQATVGAPVHRFTFADDHLSGLDRDRQYEIVADVLAPL